MSALLWTVGTLCWDGKNLTAVPLVEGNSTPTSTPPPLLAPGGLVDRIILPFLGLCFMIASSQAKNLLLVVSNTRKWPSVPFYSLLGVQHGSIYALLE